MSGTTVLIILILVSSIPVLTVYIWYHLASFEFSPIRFFLALLAGAAAIFPALILQELLNFPVSADARYSLFYHVFARIAFTEELSRLLLLLLFFWLGRLIKPDNFAGQPLSLNKAKKATATGIVAGLGFAILETANLAASDSGVLMLRAVTAAPLHAACGARIGAAAVMLRSNPFQAIMRILTATVIHGVYNVMIVLPGISTIAAVLIALTALATSVIFIKDGWRLEQSAVTNGEEKPYTPNT